MKYHFIAIGGSAMHNLALELHRHGHIVSGSDDVIYEPSKSRLKEAGILPFEMGWFTNRITKDIDAVILGMHAKADNPELLIAQELQIQIFSYPEFLFESAKDKTRVVIGGSHGKTTITAMVLHVLNAMNIDTDFMVGAQLEGFDNMVSLSKNNEFILLEGDEYLTSPLDLTPKFHWYQPNIALLTGLAWDHINVFPTFEQYIAQFKIFIKTISLGGVLIYNEDDPLLNDLVTTIEHPIRKIPYRLPDYTLQDGVCMIETDEGKIPLQIFGQHNLSNVAGAKWICQQMRIDEPDFYESITSFKGASKRLELLWKNSQSVAYKDFAHAPSKVVASTLAVREQYPSYQLVACLELHTFSSLNPKFIKEYKNSLINADIAVVFYDHEALQLKEMSTISADEIKEAFDAPNLFVFTRTISLQEWLFHLSLPSLALLLMSSGNYGGLNFHQLQRHFNNL